MKKPINIFMLYKNAFEVFLTKPFRLWGLSLLAGFLSILAFIFFGSLPIIAICISVLISTSMSLIYLNAYRGKDVNESISAVNVFDCMKDWKTVKRVLCGVMWSYLWIFLWSLIPFAGIVFGTIKAYQYRFVPYIMMTKEDVAPTEAIKVSREMTEGYKGKMFLADLLYGVAIWVTLFVLQLLGKIPFIGFIFIITFVLVYIAILAFSGLFVGIYQAGFYEEANGGEFKGGRKKVDTQPVGMPVYGNYPQQPMQQPVQQPMPNVPMGVQMPVQPIVEQPVQMEQPVQAAPVVPVQENAVQTAPVVQTEPIQNKFFCSNCGAEYNEGEAFCYNCGNKLK